MDAALYAIGILVINLFKSRRRLEAENVWLRHQLQVALRRAPARLHLRRIDRAIMVWMARLWPELLGSVQVVKPETILRWHRAGFRAFWRWKSRGRAGRPRINSDLRVNKRPTLTLALAVREKSIHYTADRRPTPRRITT